MLRDSSLIWLLCIAVGFFLGSIMFSQIVPKLFLDKDIYTLSSDHNSGATNVLIVCGPWWGLLCLSLDMLKGFLPVFIGNWLLDTHSLWFAALMAAPVLGHAIAPFNHFHGGKCISTAFGVLVALFPVTHIVLLLAGIYLVFSTVLKINPDRIRSMVSFSLFGVVALVLLILRRQYSVALGCVVISLVAVMKHSRYFQTDTGGQLDQHWD